MGHCQMYIYGEALYQHLLTHPRRTTHIQSAKLGVMPPFMAYERHWPWYDPPEENMAVPGTDCYDITLVEARRLYEEYNAAHDLQSGFFITLVDLDPDWFHEKDKASYADPLFSWAKLNMLETFWRPHRDISMPPPATERLLRYKSRMRGLSAKKYLLTFKGTLNRHPVRKSLATLHNESAGILILDSSKQNAGYDFDDLTTNSKFTLVVRGDVQYSYRFTEAVCSGAVPILVADGWVPPFTTLVPFEAYGLRILEEEWQGLVALLLSVGDQQWLDMQHNALAFCHNNLVSVHHQFDTMISLLLSNDIQ
ncbi:hypothetical protein ABBQ38_000718 [Trebouxia sp. C0009 RCD-2024]